MFYPDIDSLFDVSIADALVDDDSNSGLGDVVDYTCLAMVYLVRHAVAMSDKVHGIFITHVKAVTNPFCTAPFAFISTISPTLYSISTGASIDPSPILILSKVCRQRNHTLLFELA